MTDIDNPVPISKTCIIPDTMSNEGRFAGWGPPSRHSSSLEDSSFLPPDFLLHVNFIRLLDRHVRRLEFSSRSASGTCPVYRMSAEMQRRRGVGSQRPRIAIETPWSSYCDLNCWLNSKYLDYVMVYVHTPKQCASMDRR